MRLNEGIFPGIKEARNVRELLTEEVKAAYQSETDAEERAMIAADLRGIARAGKFVKEFDDVFKAFKQSVDEAEQAILDQHTEGQAAAKPDNRLNMEIAEAALQDLGISVRYNMLLKEVEIVGLPFYFSKDNATNILPVYLYDYLKACGYEGVTALAIDGYLACIADMNRYNPVKKYLIGGQWDGNDRFLEIFRILGVTEYKYQTYIVKWFMQCVALALNDEEAPIGADGVLVLQGEQGLAKTSFFRIMSRFPRWFVEGAIIDMRDKDTMINGLGGWITELGELDSTLKREQSSLKAFITRPEDRIRAPYAKNQIRAVRRTSFCGTVNPKDYLRDNTGNRRFWTIPLTTVDKKALFALPHSWIDQLWYQTYDMYQADPTGFRLTDEERTELMADSRGYEKPLKYEVEVRELLDFSLPVSEWEWWRTGDVAKMLPMTADAGQVGRALNKIMDRVDLDIKRTRTLHGVDQTLLPIIHPKTSAVGWRGG